MTTRFGSDPDIVYNPDLHVLMLTNDDERLQYLMTTGNTDLQTTMDLALDTLVVIRQTLEAGGRVLLLTPASQEPQELTLQQEV